MLQAYYSVALAPAIGALAGIGAVTAWRARRSMAASRTLVARILLAAALALTTWWACVLLGRSAGSLPWLPPLILVCGLAAAAVVIAERWLPGRAAALSVAPLALVASLAGPLAYSIDTAATPHTGALPSAGPSVASSGGAACPRRRLPVPLAASRGDPSGRRSCGGPAAAATTPRGRSGPRVGPGSRSAAAGGAAASAAAWAAAPRSPARSRGC